MATDGTTLLAATDPGSTLGGNATLPTWLLASPSGTPVQQGTGDLASCGTRAGDSCMSPAIRAAITPDASRFAVVSQVAASLVPTDTTRGTVLFGTASGGEVARLSVDFIPVDVGLDDTGHTIAVAGTTVAGIGSTAQARLRIYDWSGPSPKAIANATALAPARGVAVSPDGRLIGLAADHGVRLKRDGTGATALPGAGAALAVAATRGPATNESLVVAAYDNGLLLAVNATGGMRASLPLTSHALARVAATRDGSRAAAMDTQGNVWAVTDLAAAPRIGTATLAGASGTAPAAARGLAWSGDGNFLAASADTAVGFWHVVRGITDNRLAPQWHDEASDTPAARGGFGDVAADASGERAAAALGGALRTYRAVHSASVVVAAVPPRTNGTFTTIATVTDTGNRPFASRVSATAPAGWLVDLATSNVSLEPGGAALVDVHVTLPPALAPATYELVLNTTLAQARLPVVVPRLSDVRLVPVGATSLGIASGGSAVFLVRVENHGNAVETLSLRATSRLPGWVAHAEPSATVLAPGKSVEVQAIVVAPATAGKGDAATVDLEAAGAHLELTATVGAAFAPKLDVALSLGVAPGNATSLPARITNGGNAPDTFTLLLTAPPPPGWTVTFDGTPQYEVRDLAPGSSVTPVLRVQAPASAPAGSSATLHVALRSAAAPFDPVARDIGITVAGAAGAPSPSTASGKSPGLPTGWLLLGVVAAAAMAAARRAGR